MEPRLRHTAEGTAGGGFRWVHGGGGIETLLHAGAEFRIGRGDPGAERRPGLFSLGAAEMFVEGIKALGRHMRHQGRAKQCFRRLQCRRQRGDGFSFGIRPGFGHRNQRSNRASTARRQQHIAHTAQHGGVAGKPTWRVVIRTQRAGAGQANGAPTRPNAENAAIGSGDAHGTARIRPHGEISQARRSGGSRTARRPAREAIRRGGIFRRALPDILAGQTIGQFNGLGLAGKRGSRLHKLRNHHRIADGRRMRRCPIGIAITGNGAGHIKQILGGKAEPRERAGSGTCAHGALTRNEGANAIFGHAKFPLSNIRCKLRRGHGRGKSKKSGTRGQAGPDTLGLRTDGLASCSEVRRLIDQVRSSKAAFTVSAAMPAATKAAGSPKRFATK